MNEVLVLNAGSSSLKWKVLDADTEALVSHGATTWNSTDGGKYGAEVRAVLTHLPPVAVVGQVAVSSVETLDGTKLVFEYESWHLFRLSGTEPVLRVYAEATSVAKRETLLDEGCRLAE